MSKNKIAPKNVARYVVTSAGGDEHYCRSQSEAKRIATGWAAKGYKKVHMFRISYDFYEKF